MEFTALEKIVLREICKQYPQDQGAMEAQLATASVRSRENTGAGFFTNLDVRRDPAFKIPHTENSRGEVNANVAGLESGIGFILFLKDGYLDYLEGYSFEETTVPIDWETVSFELISPDEFLK